MLNNKVNEVKAKAIIRNVYIALTVSAVLLFLLALYFTVNKKNDEAYITTSIAIGLIAGSLILRLQKLFFPGSFNNKPTREELEERAFGNKIEK